jgi:hypothetical protein
MPRKKNNPVELIIQGGGKPPTLVNGGRNIRWLSARYIADLQADWEQHGLEVLAIYRERFPERYIENYAMLARVIRLEAEVKHTVTTPKTIDDALNDLESKVGKKGRQKFEKFLSTMGDDDDEIIDVEPVR